MSEPEVSWLPAWVTTEQVERTRVVGERGAFRLTRPKLSAWPQVTRRLRTAAHGLRVLGVTDIVAAIDAAAARWCDRSWPDRMAARDRVVSATGMSEESVDRSFDVELRNYRAPSLLSALAREFGDPAVLDGPTPDRTLNGATIAVGPELACQVLTGNVPGLAALGLVRTLLVKSAVIVKVASGEPTFAAAFASTLADVERAFADAILVTYWDRADLATRAAVLGEADIVVAYGTDEACATFRAATRPDQRFVAHGHKLSVGLLSSAYLAAHDGERIARQVAHDASMFDQNACIAAQSYLVEGEPDQVAVFAGRVASAMADYAVACPLGDRTPGIVAGRAMRLAAARYRAAASPIGHVWHGPDWTVVLDDTLTEGPGGGDRQLRIVAVPTLARALDMLRPVGSHLQNVAVGGTDHELPALTVALAGVGATRLCAPGQMSGPSLAWRHDGQPRISELVRWCDIEAHPWTTRLDDTGDSRTGRGDGATDAIAIPRCIHPDGTVTGRGDRLHATRR